MGKQSGDIVWYCAAHRTQLGRIDRAQPDQDLRRLALTAVANEAASCYECATFTTSIDRLTKVHRCGRCGSKEIQIAHRASTCDYVCQGCGETNTFSPCPLQRLARDVVVNEAAVWDEEFAKERPLPQFVKELSECLAENEGVHLQAHYRIEALTEAYRNKTRVTVPEHLQARARSAAPSRIAREDYKISDSTDSGREINLLLDELVHRPTDLSLLNRIVAFLEWNQTGQSSPLLEKERSERVKMMIDLSKRITELDPLDPKKEYLRQLTTPSARAHLRSNEAAEPFLQTAERYLLARDFANALTAYEDAEAADPTSAIIKLYKGDAYYGMNKFDKAIECYRACVALDPLNYQAYRFLGDTYFRMRRPDLAISALVSSILCDPNYENAWTDLSQLGKGVGLELHRHKVKRLADVSIRSSGGRLIVFRDEIRDKPFPVVNAWHRFAATLMVQGGDRPIVHSDGSDADVGPSRDAVSKAYSALAEVWSIAKSQSPELQEHDLDFMSAIRTDGLLDAYLFLEEFRESWRSDFEKWKQENRDQARRYFQTHLLVHKPRQL